MLSLLLVLALSARGAQAPEDPYLWLEDVTGEKALEWVRARDEVTLGELASNPEFQALEGRIRSILDSDDRIPYVSKLGKHYYNFWKDAKNPRGLWRRTTLASFQTDQPQWEVVLDVDALGQAEGESWVWHGASCLEPKNELCLVSLSRGGSDADVVREFDVRQKRFVEGGFTVPEAKSEVGWIDRDHIYVGTDFGPGSLTTSGYPRVVKRWTRGTPLSSAQVVFEGPETDVGVSVWHDPTKGYERDFASRAVTFWTNEMFVLQDGQPVRLDKPDDAEVSVDRQWIYVTLRSDWTVGDRTWLAGSLLVEEFDAFLAGKREFDVLFEPTERTSLAGFSTTRDYVILNTMDNVRNRLTVMAHTKVGWTRTALPGLPDMSTVSAWAIDSTRSNAIFATSTDYITPTTLYLGTAGKGAPKKIKELPAFFDAKGLQIAQHEARSADGTSIPYFQVSRADRPADGQAPTLLYGYGGFEAALTPNYSGTVGAAWLEKGGVYVVANIRGGGEFGPRWHQAALKMNRNKAYEDFAAVARDLVARKVTSEARLGILGGSNGGLLVGNMITMYPELMGAAVCMVPLLDMRRYSHLLAGASWMGEYGDPDDPEQWAWLQRYSPYHNVTAEMKTPRTLFMTSTRDDRVHPGHARKMAARMLEQGHDLLYYENMEGGHGGAADNKQAARMWALAYTFLWNELAR